MTIEIRDLRVAYGNVEVLGPINAVVPTGQWLAPIGANGAGKSTLLRALAGLLSYGGSISLNGEAVTDLGRRRVAQLIAFVPQRPQLPPTMTIADYVLLGRTPHIPFFATEKRHDHEIVHEVLERLYLSQLAHRRLGEISGGESQRAVLARALAQGAPIMLLDEPTSSLDLGRQQQVLELVDELRRERELTVVSAMHDLTLAGQFADELWLIEAGTIVSQGSPSEVLTSERVRAHYGAHVQVMADQHGGIAVIPLRDSAREPLGRPSSKER